MCRGNLLLAALLVGSTFAHGSFAAEPGSRQQDEQAIRQTAQEYLAALARGDAKALAGFWTPDGDVVDEQGRSTAAREVIAQESRPAGEGTKPEIKLTSSSIRFLSAEVALEDGTSEVRAAINGLPPLGGRFTVIWVKQDGKWRLASLRESRIEPPSTVAQLADLDWMTGDWSGQNGDTVIEVSAHWNPNRTFLLRDLKVLRGGQAVFQGTQRIGWDPLTRTIKSWVFDSGGGHGEGTWTRAGDSWVVQASGVLGDGRQTTSTNVYAPDGKDSSTWKSIGTLTDGERMPDLDIKLVRKPAAK